MESIAADASLDLRLARRLRGLRRARGWSLDDLAARAGVSRATLSRLENAAASPTAQVLGRIAAAHGLALSRLMLMVEERAAPLIPAADQPVWTDPETGFRRRAVSPPAAGARIAYPVPPRPGLEHHLLLREGWLTVTLDDAAHALAPGDALRYRLFGPSAFETPADSGARYLMFLV